MRSWSYGGGTTTTFFCTGSFLKRDRAVHNSTTAEMGETLQIKALFFPLFRQRHAKWAWSKEKTERNRRERRQCAEDLWVGPVFWLWAWSLCGPLLCNIHRSSGSYVSACGCNVHTCTHAHPDTHTYTVQTQCGHTRLLATEESSHCAITPLLCHWDVDIRSPFPSVHLWLFIIPVFHLTPLCRHQ